jgi:hypothetical protein
MEFAAHRCDRSEDSMVLYNVACLYSLIGKPQDAGESGSGHSAASADCRWPTIPISIWCGAWFRAIAQAMTRRSL